MAAPPWSIAPSRKSRSACASASTIHTTLLPVPRQRTPGRKRRTRRTIPQRELRNNIAAILREAQAGTEFTITVRGRPVAKLSCADENQGRRVSVRADELRAKLAATPVDRDFAPDIARLRELEPPADL
jgi:prevent-host-death family protein